ncbi:MAG: VOC family protein [Nitriliruptorales bacterium]
MADPIAVQRLNHAVLFVRDVERSVRFYRDVFGFEEIVREAGGRAAFLRARGSQNHHDLGLFEVGSNAPDPPRGTVGLYHLAWEVPTIEDLAAAREVLVEAGAYSGESDHGATKSLYGHDPDGNEFEIMWMLPRDRWGEHERRAIIAPLDLAAEVAEHGSD